jgi:TPR repeat protein
VGNALAGWFQPLEARLRWSARQYNLAHMAVWAVLFVTMLGTGFLSKPHPGSDPAFWQQACEDGRFNSCQTWIRFLDRACSRGSAVDCNTLGQVFLEGRLVARAPLQAGMTFGQACDLGWREGCASLREFVRVEGLEDFRQSCNNGVGALCFLLGSLYQYGLGVPQNLPQAVALFRQSCDYAFPRGCGRLGSNYFRGEGVAVDHPKARQNFEQACRGGHAPSCYNIASMYRRGLGGRQEEALARQRLQQACDLGLQSACPEKVIGASVR